MIKIKRLHQWTRAFLNKYEFMKNEWDYSENLGIELKEISKKTFKRYKRGAYMRVIIHTFTSCDGISLVNRDILFYTGLYFLDIFKLEKLINTKKIKGNSLDEKCKNFFKVYEYRLLKKYINL